MTNELAVCVVEDNQVAREAIARLIQSAGFPVRIYSSALDFLKNSEPTCVGCLVLDLRLPGMSGFELMERLVGNGSRIPVVVVSAHAETDNVSRAMALGALDFIKKPYRASVLLGRIRQGLQASHAQRRELGQGNDDSRLPQRD